MQVLNTESLFSFRTVIVSPSAIWLNFLGLEIGGECDVGKPDKDETTDGRIQVFHNFLNANHRNSEPTSIAATEKTIIGILMVPGACQFSTPIHPPRVSNKTPKNIPIPFMMIETILPTSLSSVLHNLHHMKFCE